MLLGILIAFIGSIIISAHDFSLDKNSLVGNLLAVAGANSEGLIIAVHPAAIAETNGPIVKLKGKFQGERIKLVPLGSNLILPLVPAMGSGVFTFFGRIHAFRFFKAWFISAVIG